MKKRGKSGFTLLELIIVVIVIGILASLGLPRYIRLTEKGRTTEAKNLLSAIRDAQIRYATQWGGYTSNMSALDVNLQAKYYFYNATNASSNLSDPSVVIATATRNTTVEMPGGVAIYNLTIMMGGNLTISDLSLQ